MQFRFVPMNQEYANEIVNWHYDGIYAFYNMENDIDDLEEFLNPANWVDKYYVVFGEPDEMVGFFSFEKEDETVIIGLGMKPEYTGKGLGLGFVIAGLDFAKEKFSPKKFRLSVAKFNQRAIKVYERAGFKADKTFMAKGDECEYLQMVRKV